jgi:hypothetical protein
MLSSYSYLSAKGIDRINRILPLTCIFTIYLHERKLIARKKAAKHMTNHSQVFGPHRPLILAVGPPLTICITKFPPANISACYVCYTTSPI